MRRSNRLVLACLAAFAPQVAGAGDGVLEISQICALSASGCFAGDAPGFPVTITTATPARSFRLTSDLGPLRNIDTAITVGVAGATIDLGGFRIFGSTQCSTVPVTCTPLGAGVGVLGGSDITVKNGIIHGMGGDGVRLDYSSRAESLHVFHNGGDGIELGNESIARGNVVTSNGGDGILCAAQCAVHENTTTANGLHGLEVASGSVTGNTASRNGGRGGQFGSDVGFALNQFGGNAPPNIAGGHASGGNACSGAFCSRHGRPLYYLTQAGHTGATALGACGAGFHMANLAEIHTTGALQYDSVLGASLPDSGSGPPGAGGWVRNGGFANQDPQLGNCNAWTSSDPSKWGAYALRSTDWTATAPSYQNAPWVTSGQPCDSSLQVWCVED